MYAAFAHRTSNTKSSKLACYTAYVPAATGGEVESEGEDSGGGGGASFRTWTRRLLMKRQGRPILTEPPRTWAEPSNRPHKPTQTLHKAGGAASQRGRLFTDLTVSVYGSRSKQP